MRDFVTGAVGQTVIWSAVLLALVMIGHFVVLRYRDRAVGTDEESSDLLSNFREMAQQGDIDESEYRTIKTMLGGKMQAELGIAVKRSDEVPPVPPGARDSLARPQEGSNGFLGP